MDTKISSQPQEFFKEYLSMKKIKKKRKRIKLSISIGKKVFLFLEDFFIFKKSNIEIKDFNCNERAFLYYIFQRKMHKRNSLSEIIDFENPDTLVKQIKLFKDYISEKRSLENFKFSFKQFLNFQLEKSYLLENKQPLLKTLPKEYDDILQHYFLKTSEEMNMSYNLFLDPTIKKYNNPIKCFGDIYLKQILLSPTFKNDFVNFLSNDLVHFYLKKIKMKFKNLMKVVEKKCKEELYKEKLVIKNQNINESMVFQDVIKRYFLRHKQCKLPWTKTEIIEAIIEYLYKIKKFEK
jgi:hypothetical protein